MSLGTLLLEEITHLARQYAGTELGRPHVSLVAEDDSIRVEFKRANLYAEFDVEMFRKSGNWRAVVDREMEELLVRARHLVANPRVVVRGDTEAAAIPTSSKSGGDTFFDRHLDVIRKSILPPALPVSAERQEKIARAMEGIRAGKHRELIPVISDPRMPLHEIRIVVGHDPGAKDGEFTTVQMRGIAARYDHLPTVFAEYCLAQKEIKHSRTLDAGQRAAASTEWSRQLRERIAASQERERHQVVCDPQDEP